MKYRYKERMRFNALRYSLSLHPSHRYPQNNSTQFLEQLKHLKAEFTKVCFEGDFNINLEPKKGLPMVKQFFFVCTRCYMFRVCLPHEYGLPVYQTNAKFATSLNL